MFEDKRVLFALTSLVVILLGTGNHFWHELSDDSMGTRWFAASNESTFQHMKMVLWPWLLVLGLVTWYKRGKNSMLSSGVGLLLTISTIPTLFYLYTDGFQVHHNLGADIFIFILSILLGQGLWIWFLDLEVDWWFDKLVGILIFVGVSIWFITCSYHECKNIYLEEST